ncbi:hypothetical protein [uncultured Sunxiuqinia sp.]|uniref:hypothetical protein n=1 Tax=uncultured Sunxiuqinia sp. TaxID=1573825 RepID=UPI002AA80490|nr:hypothetical protein [uncultured Sunxiuqinia sp.]
MKKLITLSILVGFVVVSCNKDERGYEIDYWYGDVQITTGFVCGWCAGADSLVVIEDAFYYEDYNPCTSENINSPIAGMN